ncbi:DNA polymerase III subunit epsilon [Candidatus Hartigia pinicola]
MSTMIKKQIVLDTETTGINKLDVHYEGHNIIEIGAVEIINRKLTGQNFHVYLKPDRPVDAEAFKIHGISDKFLQDKPTFSDIADKFIEFIHGTELIIHNAPFDIGFIDYELRKLHRNILPIAKFCQITDSLVMARQLFPGKRNNLDALCDRYLIDHTKRTLHSALFDAELLSAVYLAMTGGQTSLAFSKHDSSLNQNFFEEVKFIERPSNGLKVIYTTDQELADHEEKLDTINQKNGKRCLWRQYSRTKI